MSSQIFMMESEQEAIRLDLKTDPRVVQNQALWAGLKPDMRVADLGCGAGITTYSLRELLSPDAEICGVDFSWQRIQYAQDHYNGDGITYFCRDIRDPLQDLGWFDFIFIRFVLEYYLSQSLSIVTNVTQVLKEGGILCLIDLDHNCLNHYGLPKRLLNTISGLIDHLQCTQNFDPYAGRKLYSYLYDLNFADIDTNVSAHNVYFGNINKNQIFNNIKKMEMAEKKSGYNFEEYNGEYQSFFEEFNTCFFHPRRFSYTPLICCRGVKAKP